MSLYNQAYKQLVEWVFGVESKTLTWLGSSCSTCSLTSRSLADGRYKQGWDTSSGIIDILLAKSWIDHIDNTIDSNGSLSNVCCYDYFPSSCWSRLEDKLLLRRRQGRIQRKDLNVTELPFLLAVSEYLQGRKQLPLPTPCKYHWSPFLLWGTTGCLQVLL